MTYTNRVYDIPLKVPTISAQVLLQNNTGFAISGSTPVCIDASGDISLIDVSSEIEALATCGITVESIPNGDYGLVATDGKIENTTVGGAFGDIIYVDKFGALTNIKPSEGVNGFTIGDFVIRVGVISKNNDNPVQKDLLLSLAIVGQL
jgi:hypothetical protein